MMNSIIENGLIHRLTEPFHRSPRQVNQLHQSDAEIIRLSENLHLAVTTDSIAEEITTGLYDDPGLAGWMAVMANMSDLAAVGAQPLGILISEVLPSSYSDKLLERLQQGIQSACAACGTFVLGGDTNFGTQLLLTGTAVGIINGSKILSRIGCKPGDGLYTTNRLGSGNAFALSQFAGQNNAKHGFKPLARLNEGQTLRSIASACMDTSDGVLSTLDQLMRLNNVGFELVDTWGTTLHPQSKAIATGFGISAWLLLAGQHGEFELLFTVPPDSENTLHDTATRDGWKPLRLGNVIEEPAIYLPLHGKKISLDTERIRNLASQTDGNIEAYIGALVNIDNEIQKGVIHHAAK